MNFPLDIGKNDIEDYPRFHVAVNCVIFGFKDKLLYVLLLNRTFRLEVELMSIPGKLVDKDENLDEAAARIVKELTGVKTNFYLEQVGAYGNVDRDPRERIVSVLYYALFDLNTFKSNKSDRHGIVWNEVHQLPQLSLDYNNMVDKAWRQMRRRAITEPVGLSLLPKLFTLSELQTLYEIVADKPQDKRNFRRLVAESPYVVKTDAKQPAPGGRGRGATLYRFDRKAYENAYGKMRLRNIRP